MEGSLVSAIVAPYNRLDIVGQAIEGILGKTYKNVEALVVDDGRPMTPAMLCGGLVS
jgi:glycosyltransferase involved in cell wall biosynthesis